MGMPSMPELLVVLLIVLVLFGAKKIPDLMKGMGSGIRSFKKELNKAEEEEEAEVAKSEKIDDKSSTTQTASKPEHAQPATEQKSS